MKTKGLTVCILITLVVFWGTEQIYASSGATECVIGKDRVYAGFLLHPVGARAAGMGNAFVGLANDANATWWNPAGLAFMERRQFTATHASSATGVAKTFYWGRTPLSSDYLSHVEPMGGFGTLGLSVLYFASGPNENLLPDAFGYQAYRTSRFFETSISLSYGKQLTNNCGIGVSAKSIHSVGLVYPSSAWIPEEPPPKGHESTSGSGFAVDVGILYKTIDPLFGKPLSLGASLSNLGPRLSYSKMLSWDFDRIKPIPTNISIGFASDIFDNSNHKLTLVGEIDKLLVREFENGTADPFYLALFTAWTDEPFLYDMVYHTGIEYWYTDRVGIRMGYWNDELGKEKPMTFGVSLQSPVASSTGSRIRFDISSTPLDPGTMIVSLTIGLP